MLAQSIFNKPFSIRRSSLNKHHCYGAHSRPLLKPRFHTAAWRKLPAAGCACHAGGKWLELRGPQGRVSRSPKRPGNQALHWFVCYRWNSRRASLANGHFYLPSSTCCHSASPQHPCSAATGLWAHRRCPSPCAEKVWQPSALMCQCPWMGAGPTQHPRRWYNAAGRLGMSASPSVPSGAACGYPVRKPWKNQVGSSPRLPDFPLEGTFCRQRSSGKQRALPRTPPASPPSSPSPTSVLRPFS